MAKAYKLLAWGKLNTSDDRNRDTADHVFTVEARPWFASAVADARDLDDCGMTLWDGQVFPGHGVTIQYASGKTREMSA